MLRTRTLPTGFIEPCLPTKADTLPSGGLWVHEIKHDGFRIIARKDGARVGRLACRRISHHVNCRIRLLP
jgi:ATP-dependent DNA ligase